MVLKAAALLKLTVRTVSANERPAALSAESRLVAAAESGLSSTESGLVTAVKSRFVPAESGSVTAAESGLAGSVLTASTVSGPVAAEILSVIVIVPAEIPAMLPGP